MLFRYKFVVVCSMPRALIRQTSYQALAASVALTVEQIEPIDHAYSPLFAEEAAALAIARMPLSCEDRERMVLAQEGGSEDKMIAFARAWLREISKGDFAATLHRLRPADDPESGAG
jgi:hypothetical protein